MAKKILGISASPRKGANTDILLKMALEAAAETGDIETEFLALRDYDIGYCICCFACCDEKRANATDGHACVPIRDGMDEIYPKLLECDGLILAAPVFFGGMAAQLKMLMDRTEPLLRYGQGKWKYGLRNKVGAGIAMGGNRNGGMEATLQGIQHFFFVHDMIVVGSGPDPTPGCYLGGCGTTYPQKGKVRDAVLEDEIGTKNSRMTGRRVAEMLKMLDTSKAFVKRMDAE